MLKYVKKIKLSGWHWRVRAGFLASVQKTPLIAHRKQQEKLENMCHFRLISLPLSGSFNHWTKQAGLGLENTKGVSTAFQTLTQNSGWRNCKTLPRPERQSQSKCQCQLLPLEPESCDNNSAQPTEEKNPLLSRQAWPTAWHRSKSSLKLESSRWKLVYTCQEKACAREGMC